MTRWSAFAPPPAGSAARAARRRPLLPPGARRLGMALWASGPSRSPCSPCSPPRLHLLGQVLRADPDDGDKALALFRSNRFTGLLRPRLCRRGVEQRALSRYIAAMLSEPQAADLAAALVEAARKAGASAADAMIGVSRSSGISVRLGELEDIDHSESFEVACACSTGPLGHRLLRQPRPAGFAELAERAIAMARQAPEDPYAGLADPALLGSGESAPDLACSIPPSAPRRPRARARRPRRPPARLRASATATAARPAPGRAWSRLPPPPASPARSAPATSAARPASSRARPARSSATMPRTARASSPTSTRRKRSGARRANAPSPA
jgi:hypothetical protein